MDGRDKPRRERKPPGGGRGQVAGTGGQAWRTFPGGNAGQLGEQHAAQHLEQRGMRVRERNWRCAAGEIDLIAQDGEYLVFVEVKTRSARDAFAPVLAMTKRKQQRVRNLALRYIQQAFGGQVPPLQPRFDVVLVVLGREPQVEHLVNAF